MFFLEPPPNLCSTTYDLVPASVFFVLLLIRLLLSVTQGGTTVLQRVVDFTASLQHRAGDLRG